MEYNYYASHKDKVISNQLGDIGGGKAYSKLHCTNLCLNREKCVSVEFDRENNHCTLYPDVLDYGPSLMYEITAISQLGSCPFRHVELEVCIKQDDRLMYITKTFGKNNIG